MTEVAIGSDRMSCLATLSQLAKKERKKTGNGEYLAPGCGACVQKFKVANWNSSGIITFC